MNTVEIFGLIMSAVIAISLTQKSLLKLRIINLIGSVGFVIYGSLIISYPVIILNAFTILVNLWYLSLLLNPREILEVLSPPPGEMTFINHFLEINRNDIRKFNPRFHLKEMENHLDGRYFPILRNGTFVSLIICRKVNRDQWEVILDYVIPQYRDLKCGRYFYTHAAELLTKGSQQSDPVRTLISKTKNPDHIKYLKELGFREQEEENLFMLTLKQPKAKT